MVNRGLIRGDSAAGSFWMKGRHMKDEAPDELRWHAVITFSGDAGPYDVIHDFEELEELHDIVERGPDWHSILSIKIELARRNYHVTVEEAREL